MINRFSTLPCNFSQPTGISAGVSANDNDRIHRICQIFNFYLTLFSGITNRMKNFIARMVPGDPCLNPVK